MRNIPITPIWERYKKLRRMPRRKRLKEAHRLAEHPEELATELAISVARFASYSNIEERFYPSKRPERTFRKEVKSTNDVVLRLERQKRLLPTDAPDRRTEHDAGTKVTAVSASLLACEYVDHELLLQRTTSPAQWEDGTQNLGGLRIDVLLADAADRTPIIGELKLPGDMDPFFALVQGLACASHLATINQYERMRRHLSKGKFPELPSVPRLDVWVLIYQALQTGKPQKETSMYDLEIAAKALAARLLAQDSIRDILRRIACVGVKSDGPVKVAAEVEWAWCRLAE